MAGGKIQKHHRSGSGGGGGHRLYQGGGVPYDKSKGQHILDDAPAMEIVRMSGIKPTDVVLEIGPGTGKLTEKLLKVAKSVVAIKLDPRMVLELHRCIPHSVALKVVFFLENLGQRDIKRWQAMIVSFYYALIRETKVIQGDVLKCDLPYFDVCVANIPYQISSPLTFKLLSHRPTFRCAVIMYQQEFAMRLVAKPGDNLYCRLSVNTQLLARVSHLFKVGRKSFTPPPKVDSSVVRIEPRKPLPPVSFKEWDGLVRLCFIRKNKTLGSIFKQKKILSLMEKNYKIFQALQLSQKGSLEENENEHDVSVLADAIEDPDMGIDCMKDDEDMDLEDADIGGGGDGSSFKEKVLGVLKQGDFMVKRASNLTREHFLYLLSLFNKAGIHFS